MLRFSWILALVCGAAVGFSSCKKETAVPSPDESALFPLDLGHYVVYNVDSVYYDDFQCLTSVFKMQMRYTVADTFTDNEGRPSFRFDVHLRRTDSMPWQPHQTFYVINTGSRLELVQNNLRYIKLIFPVREGQTWDGNAFIPEADQDLQYFAGWKYRYTNVDQDMTVDDQSFTNTVTVEQTDEQLNDPGTQPCAYAYKTFSKEAYSSGVGLIYREITHWTYDPQCVNGTPTRPGCLKGYSVRMRAIDHN